MTQIHHENLKTKFILKYAPIIIQVKDIFLAVKNTKKDHLLEKTKKDKKLKKGHFGDSNPQENLKMKFTLKYVSIDFLGTIFFSSKLVD